MSEMMFSPTGYNAPAFGAPIQPAAAPTGQWFFVPTGPTAAYARR